MAWLSLSFQTTRALRVPLSRSSSVSVASSTRCFFSANNHNNHDKDTDDNTDIFLDDRHPPKMTVREAYQQSVQAFQHHNISEPDWSAAHLLASALDLPWSNGFSRIQQHVASHSVLEEEGDKNHPNNRPSLAHQVITKDQWETYQSMVQRRLQDEPLQYILGKWDFSHYEQIVIRPPLLCPRPETEELVDVVQQDIQQMILSSSDSQAQQSQSQSQQGFRILEIGAGTGVIGISLAGAIPSAHVTAIDIEPVAIETSKENAKRILGSHCEERYSVVECSAQEYSVTTTTAAEQQQQQQFDVVVSNPPYIPESDMSTLSRDVVDYESDQALCGGKDGMDVIRVIIRKWATEWGKRPDSVCWMEVDPTHPVLLQQWLDAEEQRQELGVNLESVQKDLSGRDRFVKLAFRKQ